jgi:hypothetical protein
VTSKLPLLVVLENAKDKVKGKNLIVALRRRIKCLPLFHYLTSRLENPGEISRISRVNTSPHTTLRILGLGARLQLYYQKQLLYQLQLLFINGRAGAG